MNNNDGDSEHYQTNACKFKYETLTTQFMNRCRAKANLSSKRLLFITKDSTIFNIVLRIIIYQLLYDLPITFVCWYYCI